VTLNSVKGPGGIARVTAAVFVAAKKDARTPAEIDNLRRMVANAIGIKGEDKELTKIVTLQEVSFETPAEAKPSVADPVLAHSDPLRNGIAVAVAVVIFGIFLRMLKGAKPDQIPLEFIEEQKAVRRETSGNSPVTVDMLNDMIRQKPDNVGLALRDW